MRTTTRTRELRRLHFSRALALATVAALAGTAACGGNQAAGAAPQSATGARPSPADSAVPTSPDNGATTTTTSLDDGGAGTKLAAAAQTPAAASASATPATPGPHHEPGRGVADIKAIVVAHRDEARACYDRALPAHPGIEGDLVVQWTIDPKGGVTKISIDESRSQITEPSVAACVVDIIKKLQFASSPGGYETKTSYPFNFHPHHGHGSTAP